MPINRLRPSVIVVQLDIRPEVQHEHPLISSSFSPFPHSIRGLSGIHLGVPPGATPETQEPRRAAVSLVDAERGHAQEDQGGKQQPVKSVFSVEATCFFPPLPPHGSPTHSPMILCQDHSLFYPAHRLSPVGSRTCSTNACYATFRNWKGAHQALNAPIHPTMLPGSC